LGNTLVQGVLVAIVGVISCYTVRAMSGKEQSDLIKLAVILILLTLVFQSLGGVIEWFAAAVARIESRFSWIPRF